MKRLLAVLVGTGLILGLSGCKSQEVMSTEAEKTEETQTETKAAETKSTETAEKEGALAVALKANSLPYEYYEDDKIVGIDVEIMEAVAEKLNMELVLYDMPSDAIASAVVVGKADIGIGGLTIDEEMSEKVDFSDTYIKNKQVIITSEESGIYDADDLNGKRLGVVLRSAGESLMSDIREDLLLRYDKASRAIDGLKNDRVDALILDAEQADGLIKESDGLRVLEDAYEEQEYAIITAKENDALYEKVNKILADLKKDGKIKEIIQKYVRVE